MPSAHREADDEAAIRVAARESRAEEVAEAYGVVGMRTRPDELGASLLEALSVDAPVLLEVEVPIMMPPFQVIR